MDGFVRRCAHGWRAGLLPNALLVGAVFAAYANIYGNAFLYDDNLLIVHNPALRNWADFFASLASPLSFDSSYYRPLQTLLYAIVFHLAGLSLFSFHLLNVVLHAANAVLVYMLGRKLGFNATATFLAALLWAVHPVQTEAVAYMSATADTLYAFFCLLGAIVLLPDFTPRRMAAAAAAMIGGLLSKESACVFPLLAASLVYLQDSRRFDWKIYLRLWPLALTALAYVGVRFAFMPPHAVSAGVSASPVVDYPVAALPVYLKLLVWPTRLHMGYDLPAYASIWHAAVLGGLGMAILAVMQVLCEAKTALPLNWGLCWFAAAYLPCFFVASPFYEHWLYLPSAGLFLGCAQSAAIYIQKVDPAWRRRIDAGAIAAAFVAALTMGVLTHGQNKIWRDPVTFYDNIFQQGELAVAAHINLGVIYAERGEYEKAIDQDQIAIRNSHDTRALAQANLAAALLRLPDGEKYAGEAVRHFQRALEIDPRLYPAMAALASFYDGHGNAQKADFYRKKADALRRNFSIPPEGPDFDPVTK